MGEQVVEKRALRRQTEKPTTVFFDQCCSKINRESIKNQSRICSRRYRSFEHNGVEINDQERMKGFQMKENTFVERKAKGSRFEISQETREAD